MKRPPLSDEPPIIQALYPESEAYRQSPAEAMDAKRDRANALTDNDVLIISDTDLDGLGAGTVIKAAYGSNRTGHITASHDEPIPVESTLKVVSDVARAFDTVYISDLPPNTPEDYIDGVSAIAQHAAVIICDHHNEWTEDFVSRIEPYATVTIGDGISAAEVTYNTVADQLDDDWADFAQLVTDHDCQYFDDPRSDTLVDFADAVDADTFVEVALSHGAALVEQPRVKETVASYQTAKEARIEAVVNRTQTTTYDDLMLATTYGQCPASQTAERIYDEHDADLIVFVRPHDKVNVRSRGAADGLARSVAIYLGGGGHANEAGAKSGFIGPSLSRTPANDPADAYTDPISWETHWASLGQEAQERVLRVMKHVVDDS